MEETTHDFEPAGWGLIICSLCGTNALAAEIEQMRFAPCTEVKSDE